MKIKLKGLMTKPKDVTPSVKVMRRVSRLTYAVLDAQDIDETTDEREQMRVAMDAVEKAVEFLVDVFGVNEEKVEELEQEELFHIVGYAMARLQGASDAELELLAKQEAATGNAVPLPNSND